MLDVSVQIKRACPNDAQEKSTPRVFTGSLHPYEPASSRSQGEEDTGSRGIVSTVTTGRFIAPFRETSLDGPKLRELLLSAVTRASQLSRTPGSRRIVEESTIRRLHAENLSATNITIERGSFG